MNKCFGCGKFVKLGKGNVIKVTYGDETLRYFCASCVTERVEYSKGTTGRRYVTFADYIGKYNKIEMV